MKSTHTKKILTGMIFLSSGLHAHVFEKHFWKQALTEKQPSSINESFNGLDKGKIYWWRSSQSAYIRWFGQKTPNWIGKQLTDAVCYKKPGTVLKILLLNRIHSQLNNQNDLSYLLHTAIRNQDFLTLAALVSARYRDESGTEKPLFDINYEYRGQTPIMSAIQYNQNGMADFLLQENADLFKILPTGTTLHVALQAGNSDLSMKIIKKINDQHLPNNPQLPNCSQPQKRKQFLNATNNHGETIFHTAFIEFLQERISPALFIAIIFWIEDYDFKNSNRQKQIFENAKETLIRLEDDEKWYNLLKNFKINKKTRQDLIQAVHKVLKHMSDVI
jgi:hypothetical protein